MWYMTGLYGLNVVMTGLYGLNVALPGVAVAQTARLAIPPRVDLAVTGHGQTMFAGRVRRDLHHFLILERVQQHWQLKSTITIQEFHLPDENSVYKLRKKMCFMHGFLEEDSRGVTVLE